MSTVSKVRALVVEDDPAIRSALEVALCDEGYEVRAEDNGLRIEKVLEQFRPHLAVLDVRLPQGPDGFAIARRLRSSSDVPIIFLTAAEGVDDRLAGFEAGADDYLAKPFAMAELLARVKALLRRAGHGTPSTRQVGELILDEAAHNAVRGETVLELTHTEFQLLSVLARHPGQVLSKSQLLSQVWGFDDYDPNLIEVHMSTLRRKLEAAGPRMIHTVRGAGYLLRA